tara:strand:- start:64 stop:375 length:312 start_codon:yes stop_codon:yes gene_type:complete
MVKGLQKMKFIARAKRKALEEKLATLDEFSAEAKEIRGKLGWGEPTPPAPPAPKPVAKPVAKPAPKPKAKPAVKKTPVVEESAVKSPAPKRKYTRKKKVEDKE